MPQLYHVVQLPLFTLAKVCRTCTEEKPIEMFHRSKRNSDGYENQCKSCKYAEKVARDKETGRETAYHREWNKKNRERVNERSRMRYYQNREARLKQIHEYHKEHHERRSQVRRAHHARPEIREKMRDYHVERREKHPEILRESNRAWRQANPLRIRQYAQRHRLLKKLATVGEVSYERILERDGFHCHICNKPVRPQDVEFDHVIPLSRNGPHCEDNIKVAHRVCNRRKSNKLMEELTPFMRRGPSTRNL